MVQKNSKHPLKTALLTLGIVGVLFLGVLLFMKSPLFEVELAQKEIHLELGSTPDTNPKTYLEGPDWCVPLSRVDVSNVRKTQTGRYPIYISHGFRTYTCYVNVTDTTPPKVTTSIKTKTVTPGQLVSAKSLGLDIEDYSEIESIAFTRISSTHFYTGLPEEDITEMKEAYKKGLEMYAEQFQFAYGGIYTLTITVKDAFRNSSDITLILKVEEPPIIETPENYYMGLAYEIDFAEHITAWDFIDETIDTSKVKIDTSQLKTDKAGSYSVAFSATDSYGLKQTTSATVHVLEREELQKLINTHQIDANKDVIVGAYNLYDSGYYENEDISAIQNVMLPSIVHVENDVLSTFGSGFIISIDKDFVTIATNEHVITSDLTPDITFSDGTTCNGSVVASNKMEDIAFIRIPIDGASTATSLPSSYSKTLRTVHINEGYWKSLADHANITIGYNCINANGEIWNTTSGYMIEKTAVRNWNDYKEINEMIISMKPVAGSSGSAIFDAYGHLIGMVRGYTDYVTYTETVAVPLDEILEYYQLIFKKKVQYQ